MVLNHGRDPGAIVAAPGHAVLPQPQTETKVQWTSPMAWRIVVIERSRTALDHEAEIRSLRDCYASLTRREREVMALVVSGRLNKQVGGELDISEITVKAHRGQVMRKMKADSLADLVNMAARLRAPAAKG
jgi:DNA-binding NarL/FixJ family response regulator